MSSSLLLFGIGSASSGGGGGNGGGGGDTTLEEEKTMYGVADPTLTTNSITLDGNNETKSHDVFSFSKIIAIRAIWGVVTTALGSDVTSAVIQAKWPTEGLTRSFTSSDTLSGFGVNSFWPRWKDAQAGGPIDSTSPDRLEPGFPPDAVMTQIAVVEDNPNSEGKIIFTYSTTDTPTSGVIKFHCFWEPLISSAAIAAI